MTVKTYAAFISYAHADERMAARLHKALETYPIPKTLKGAHRSDLSPIFRDAAELNAHHSLPDKIREAVTGSKYLIVLCSPAAKASHWVNEEIRLFRKIHGEASILCVLAEGTPDTAFPPALLDGGREPLAANISGPRERFNLGVTGLAASMLGVGLDDLVQRDQKRRRARGRFITAGALAFSAIMGALTLTAMRAQNAAEISRTEAENMVEFMLTDLKAELEPLGKLSVLDAVGARVSDYYGAIPLRDMDDDRMARQARARHLIGQVALDERDMETAKAEIEAAYKATAELMRRNPDDTDAVFAHAQSAFWLGSTYRDVQDYENALPYWREYDVLGAKLYAANPDSLDMLMEAAWGQSNLAILEGRLGRHEVALGHCENALKILEIGSQLWPEDIDIISSLAYVLANQSRELTKLKKFDAALRVRTREITLMESLYRKTPNMEYEFDIYLTRLNFWEIKNQAIERCNLVEPSNLLRDLKEFLKNDPENKMWKVNYRAYEKEFLSLCKKDIATSDLKNRIAALESFARGNGLMSAKFEADMDALKRPD